MNADAWEEGGVRIDARQAHLHSLTPPEIRPDVFASVCATCGALVPDERRDKHEAWHAGLMLSIGMAML